MNRKTRELERSLDLDNLPEDTFPPFKDPNPLFRGWPENLKEDSVVWLGLMICYSVIGREMVRSDPTALGLVGVLAIAALAFAGCVFYRRSSDRTYGTSRKKEEEVLPAQPRDDGRRPRAP